MMEQYIHIAPSYTYITRAQGITSIFCFTSRNHIYTGFILSSDFQYREYTFYAPRRRSEWWHVLPHVVNTIQHKISPSEYIKQCCTYIDMLYWTACDINLLSHPFNVQGTCFSVRVLQLCFYVANFYIEGWRMRFFFVFLETFRNRGDIRKSFEKKIQPKSKKAYTFCWTWKVGWLRYIWALLLHIEMLCEKLCCGFFDGTIDLVILTGNIMTL